MLKNSSYNLSGNECGPMTFFCSPKHTLFLEMQIKRNARKLNPIFFSLDKEFSNQDLPVMIHANTGSSGLKRPRSEPEGFLLSFFLLACL